MANNTSSHGQTDSALASEAGIRALKISLAGLLITAALQAVVALLSGSAGLLADTIHNFADAFTAVPLWIAFALARRAANRRFTYGYGRAEDMAGLIILLFVVLSAGLAAYESYLKLARNEAPRFLELSMAAAVVGMIGNEIVARYKIRVGEQIGSAALVAEGKHSRADSLTSLAAFFGLLGARLGFPLADPIAGLVITLAILRIGWEVGRDEFGRLMDAIEPEVIEAIERTAAHVPGVEGIHDVRARWLGHNITLEIHVSMNGDLTLIEAHTIGEAVRYKLLEHIPRSSEIIVHIDPVEGTLGEFHQHDH